MAADLPLDPAVRARAADFLARRDAGWSDADAAAFAAWRAADPRHNAAVARLESAERLLRRLPATPAAAALLAELEVSLPAAPAAPRKVIAGPWRRLAVGLAAAAALAFVAWTLGPRTAEPLTYTAASQHRSIDLNDGSTLLLNRDSSVDVDFRRTERRISLRQGEAHFSVARDASRPFIVAAGAVRVRAVGTAFNVRLERDAIAVVVTEGKVEVSRADSAAADPLFLVAGEGTTLPSAASGARPVITRQDGADARARAAWTAPRLEFSDTPLAEVVTRFNRYSRVQLELGDPELGTRAIGGAFAADNAEAFANLLLASGDIRLERVSETKIILRKAR